MNTHPTARLGGDHRVRRMPRSNAPHPEESLAGYLLNLAYRLHLRPDDILRRTALKTTGRIHLLDAQYAIAVPVDPRQRLCRATGLTESEARNLTIERYEGVTYTAHAAADTARTARSLHGQQWVNLGRTRYCPECLTGDNLDSSLGSADPDDRRNSHALWKVEWLTAWSLACTRHQCLLLDNCPHCGHPTGSSGARLMSAIPNPDSPIVHPAACRAALTSKSDSLCNQRLDQVRAPAAPEDVLALQVTLDAVLRGTTPAGLTSLDIPVDGAEYLRDLRLLTILLQLADARSNLRVLDTDIAHDTRTYLKRRAASIASGEKENRALTQPPDQIAAAAGLLITAAKLLADPTSTGEITDLHDRVRREQPVAWDKACRTVPPSQRLFAVIADTKIGFADPRRLRHHTQHLSLTITADEIPAYLDKDNYIRHFAETHPRYERSIRRCVPLMLVRLLTGCDSATAGRHLGYAEAPTLSAIARAGDAFDNIGLDQFRSRLAAVAAELDAAPRTNYARRRNHFDHTWNLPDHTWEHLKRAMRDRGLVRPSTNLDPRRTAIAAWIWQLVTQGDHTAAPMVLTTGSTKRHTGGQADLLLSLQQRSPLGVHDLVDITAQGIAEQIDATLIEADGANQT